MRAFLKTGLPLLALLALVAAAARAEDAVQRRRDDVGRVVYGQPISVPDGLDDDLLPGSTEDLIRELRHLPMTWTASKDVPFAELIREASLRYGVEAGLIEAVMATESAFNPFAVSRAGAIGLMQLMPDTASRYGVSDIYDPRENVLGGTRYLSYLLTLFDGDLDRVLAGYNAGENAVLRYGGIPPYRETRGYVRKVRRYLHHLESRAAGRAAASAEAEPVEPATDHRNVSLRPARPPKYLLKPSPAAAAIYHYVDDRGVVHFTNVAPENPGGKVHVWRPGK